MMVPRLNVGGARRHEAEGVDKVAEPVLPVQFSVFHHPSRQLAKGVRHFLLGQFRSHDTECSNQTVPTSLALAR